MSDRTGGADLTAENSGAALLCQCGAPRRAILRNPVRQFRTQGSVRGQSGNWLSLPLLPL